MKSIKTLVITAVAAVSVFGMVSCGSGKSKGNPIESAYDLEGQEWIKGTWQVTAEAKQDALVNKNTYKIVLDGAELDSTMTYIFEEDGEVWTEETDGFYALLDELDYFVECNVLSDEDVKLFEKQSKKNGASFKYEGDNAIMTNGKDLISVKVKGTEKDRNGKHFYKASFIMKKISNDTTLPDEEEEE